MIDQFQAKNASVAKFDPDGCFDLKAISVIDYFSGKLLAKWITRDKFGYTIMERWFNGLGKKLVIANDTEWNRYLLENKNFVNKIEKHAGTAVYKELYEFDVRNEWLGLDLSDHGEGDYWSGYGLINGSNSNYGGFCVKGSVQHIENNRYHVVATYEFNDYIDPGDYRADKVYAVGAWAVLGPCINYELQISGTVEFDFYYG